MSESCLLNITDFDLGNIQNKIKLPLHEARTTVLYRLRVESHHGNESHIGVLYILRTRRLFHLLIYTNGYSAVRRKNVT